MSGMKKWEHLKISFQNIKDATNDFGKTIGKGGYGWVYEGELLINGRNIKVAVKRLNEKFGQQGLKEFLTEIQLLSGQRHENIVTLIGYCDEGKEKIIVYEYAQHGSLDKYIRRSDTNHTLSWLERLKIVVDAARGLDHLHDHGPEHKTVIHRDIKCSNILLDHNWVAKISDLGLSKLTFSGLGASTVVSDACGTLNYLEPEYNRTGMVNKKSDVFSFGMVLFEVLCGRLCYVRDADGILLLADVAKEYYANDKLDRIIDPILREEMSIESLRKYSAIAYKCLRDREHRPLMGVVVKELEETLKIQARMQTSVYLESPISNSAGERLIRAVRRNFVAVKILKVAVYRGNSLELHVTKPRGFKYNCGQYLFVNCADVSRYDWRPFFITSAPGDDYLSVHIQILGNWTRQLKTVFSEACQPPSNAQGRLLRPDYRGENPSFPKILIDGPYGARAQDYKKYDVVLLVGLGIGATSMISIIKDMMNNMKAKEEEENALNSVESQNNKSGPTSEKMKTTRAYFYWITGEQGTFEWFKDVLDEATEWDNRGFIQMHNFCTSTMPERLNHFPNTRVKFHSGRPNWRDVYRLIAVSHDSSIIGVFYCGTPKLAQELKQLASDFTQRTATKFEFHDQSS